MPPNRTDVLNPTDSVSEGAAPNEQSPLLSSSPTSYSSGGGPVVLRNLSVMSRLSYGMGHVLNDVCASMWFSYTLLFLHAVLGMPGANAGALLMWGQVVDALATPLVGMIADRPLSGPLAKYGRRKVCHLAGSLMVIVSFPFIFMPCWVCDTPSMALSSLTSTTASSLSQVTRTPQFPLGPPPMKNISAVDAALEAAKEFTWWQETLYYWPLVAIFQIGWAAVQIAHLSLIPDLTDSDAGRTELTAIRYTMSVCSSVVVYLITWSVLHVTRKNPLDQIGPQDAYKFKNIVLIGVFLGFIFTLWFHLGLKEPPSLQQRVSKLDKEESQAPLLVAKAEHKSTASFFRDPRLYQAALLYVSSRLFSTLSQVFVPLYLDESLGEDAESLALVPLATFVASFAASLGVKRLNVSCGRVATYMLGALLCVVSCVWIYIGEGDSYEDREIYFVAILLGAGSSVTQVTSLCITADLIGASTDSGAAVYSAVTFADKLINGLAVMLIESLKCGDPLQCPHYYRDAVALVCGGTVVIGIAALITYWRPSQSGVNGRFRLCFRRFFGGSSENRIP